MPLTKINLFYGDIYRYTATQITALVNFIMILSHTTVFMSKQLLGMLFVEANTEIVLYIMCAFSVFMFLLLNDQQNKIDLQTEQIESLEARINYLKKMERMHEEVDESWIQDIKLYQKETTKKMAIMDRKIKKFEKDLKIYE